MNGIQTHFKSNTGYYRQVVSIETKTLQNHLNIPKPPSCTKAHSTAPAIDANSAYEKQLHNELKILVDKLENYLSSPDSHPLYNQEWQLFWKRKYDELTEIGLDPLKFNFDREWSEYFIDRIHELHEQETRQKILELQRKVDITDSGSSKGKNTRQQSVDRAKRSVSIQESSRAGGSKSTEAKRLRTNEGPSAGRSRARVRFHSPLIERSSSASSSSSVVSLRNDKSKMKAIERLEEELLPIIVLENVPLSMGISSILDYFGGKVRTITGCFRIANYTRKVCTKTVYLYVMDRAEIDMLVEMKEIYIERNCVKISSKKFLSGNAILDTSQSDHCEEIPNVFLGNLERRDYETTFYLRELVKLFGSKSKITGIKIAVSEFRNRSTRGFGFVNFISKAFVDEYKGRCFKVFGNEIPCKVSRKVPLMIDVKHFELINHAKPKWSKELRAVNLLMEHSKK